VNGLRTKIRLILSFILLFAVYSQAGEYQESVRFYAEPMLDKNYNVKLVFFNYGNKHTEKYIRFSYDLMYIRVIKDSSTWRFYFPIIPYTLGFVAIFFSDPYERQRGLFNPSLESDGIVASLPSMLMNPMLAFPLTSNGSVSMGIGYNTDFTVIPRPQLYFAPKAQIEWLFPSGLGLATTTSYQVFDCFATKQGVKFGLLFFSQGRL
jgi:hypothetical protein